MSLLSSPLSIGKTKNDDEYICKLKNDFIESANPIYSEISKSISKLFLNITLFFLILNKFSF